MSAPLHESANSALPVLNRAAISTVASARMGVLVPTDAMLALPERAVQFGTGGFLRAFADAFVDRANHAGDFNGRIVAVASTGSGRNHALSSQECLFTIVHGDANDTKGDETAHVVGSVSRALSAVDEWNAVLEVARNPAVTLILSNTTEAGFALDAADVNVSGAPRSFPAKLATFLLERANTVQYNSAHRVFVVPCELVENNGDALRALVCEQANTWRVSAVSKEWIAASVTFCNTLVDRIVPGIPDGTAQRAWATRLGYGDSLLTVAEDYAFFAIEGSPDLADALGFVRANSAVHVVSSVRPYRERKVRLLNGAHSCMAALGLLAGTATVRDVMHDSVFASWIGTLMHDDIVPVLDVPEATEFANATLVRFANPAVHHKLADIAVQGTTKVRVRLLPLFRKYAEQGAPVPERLVLAFSAQLLLNHPEQRAKRASAGASEIADELAVRMANHWQAAQGIATMEMVQRVLADVELWHDDISSYPMLSERVVDALQKLSQNGAAAAMREMVQHTFTPTVASVA